MGFRYANSLYSSLSCCSGIYFAKGIVGTLAVVSPRQGSFQDLSVRHYRIYISPWSLLLWESMLQSETTKRLCKRSSWLAMSWHHLPIWLSADSALVILTFAKINMKIHYSLSIIAPTPRHILAHQLRAFSMLQLSSHTRAKLWFIDACLPWASILASAKTLLYLHADLFSTILEVVQLPQHNSSPTWHTTASLQWTYAYYVYSVLVSLR